MYTFVDYLHPYFPKSSGRFNQLSDMLLRFKHGHAYELTLFKNELSAFLSAQIDRPTFVCTIPSSNPNRVNSITTIAQQICKTHPLLVDGTYAITKRYRTPNACAGKQRPLQAFINSFSIQDMVMHKHVLLLDDVSSSGFSMSVLHDLLLEHGATSVYCLALFQSQQPPYDLP